MKTKPIDRSKKSNRRCWNCLHYKDCEQKIIRMPNGDSYEAICHTAGGKLINYWNSCKHFQWNPEKNYL